MNKYMKMKKGMLSAVSVVLLIIVVIVANVLISSQDYTFDMTANQLYSISDETKSILNDLDQDIVIYVINDKSYVNDTYARIFSNYAKASKHIKFKYRSSETYPNFTSDYVDNVETVPDDSVIVTCGDKYRYVSSEDFYDYEYDYSSNSVSDATLKLEGVLTQAIEYVTSDEVPVIYTLTGHSETDLSSSMQEKFEQDNYTVESLNLLSTTSVPDDCRILLINGPQKDLSEDETKAISDYMNNGGKVYIYLNALTDDLTNLYSILKEYNVGVNNGVVVETDSSMYYQEAIYLIPEIESADATAAQYNQNVYILAPTAKGLTDLSATASTEDASSESSDYTVIPLLSTSEGAYSKINTKATTLNKEKGDIDGPFDIAVAVTNGDEPQMVVVGCANMLLENVDSVVNGTNSDFAANCANYLSGQEEKISIRSKSVVSDTVVVPAFAQKVILACTVAVVPLAILLCGILIVLKRRKL